MAEWSIAAVLKTVELKGSRGSNPCLSAINLVNQGIAKLVHGFVHESPIFGAFLLPFRVTTPIIKKPGRTGLQTLFHNVNCGFRNNVSAKILHFLENPSNSGKNLFNPIQYRRTFQVQQHRDK